MDKRLILAVAGSGKTSLIIENLNLEKRCLLVTYTQNNYHNLRQKVIKKFGYLPENIRILTYETFLYRFCVKPFLSYKLRPKGVTFDKQPPRFAKGVNRYMDSNKRLYASRICQLLIKCGRMTDVIKRVDDFYDAFYIDEVQDFAGHDFDLLVHLKKSNVEIMFVGDFYQHTFSTSRDGSKNKSLHKNYDNFKQKFIKIGIEVDEECLSKSYRCSPTVCEFITNNIGISIESHNVEKTNIRLVDSSEEIEVIMKDDSIIKLFYQNCSKYDCYSKNWGVSKGEDCHTDVCVILNRTTMAKYKKGQLDQLAPTTKNKFYVACSRAKRHLYFIEESKVKHYKII